jgi:hypothetical protein
MKRGDRKPIFHVAGGILSGTLDELQLVEGFVGVLSAKKHGYGRVCRAPVEGAAAGEEKADRSRDHIDDRSGFGG